ncbi:MAG TPA: malonic semialdehyde reductase [Sphingomonadales bacterium]|nr:malonic semialdehyde reductase [Sphingomonadales bacterium]
MRPPVNDHALDQLFRKARSYNRWAEADVPAQTLYELYELMKFGPTSANCSPLRIVFVKSPAAKARLKPHLIASNVVKVMTAPVTAILAYDTLFYDLIPELFPHNPEARSWFSEDPKGAEENAFRNSSLQGAYFILAARALGLDCGPMSGFDQAGVNQEFFPGGRLKSNFICALGQGTNELLFPRSPRLPFERACQIL